VLEISDTPDRDPVRHALSDRPVWLRDGEPADPARAEICVAAPGDGGAWAVLSPEAARRGTAGGRVILAHMVNLRDTTLALDGRTYRALLIKSGPGRTEAPESFLCPVCHQPVEQGESCYRCSCGALTDSAFCACGGAEQFRCFACGEEGVR